MTRLAHEIPVDGGTLSVIDYGGTGRDVLLVHSLGYSAPQWDPVGYALAQRCHPYALDVRAHGRSTAPLTDAQQPVSDVAAVVSALGLQRPVLVGHDTGGYQVIAASILHPGLAGAIVAIGGAMIRSREEVKDLIAFASSDDMREGLRERFSLGATGRGDSSRRALLDALIERARQDWLVNQFVDGLRAEAEWSIRDLPDGSWLHTPTPEAVVAGHDVRDDAAVYPDIDMYARLTVPTLLVLPQDGFDADVADRLDALATDLPQIRAYHLPGGQFPQYMNTQELTDLIADLAAETA